MAYMLTTFQLNCVVHLETRAFSSMVVARDTAAIVFVKKLLYSLCDIKPFGKVKVVGKKR